MPDFMRQNFRIKELCRIFESRYRGSTLPDDDAGRGDLKELLFAHASSARCTPGHLLKIAADWAPGFDARNLIDKILATPLRYRRRKAETVGKSLLLRFEERERLGVRTIRCFDKTQAEIRAIRRQCKTDYERARRREMGVRPREQYLANSLSRLKPWLALGMSERTWYRKGKPTAPANGRGLRSHSKNLQYLTNLTLLPPVPAPPPLGFQGVPGSRIVTDTGLSIGW
jgi:hypothetical protein